MGLSWARNVVRHARDLGFHPQKLHKPNVVVHACHPRTQKSRSGRGKGSGQECQAENHVETLPAGSLTSTVTFIVWIWNPAQGGEENEERVVT